MTESGMVGWYFSSAVKICSSSLTSSSSLLFCLASLSCRGVIRTQARSRQGAQARQLRGRAVAELRTAPGSPDAQDGPETPPVRRKGEVGTVCTTLPSHLDTFSLSILYFTCAAAIFPFSTRFQSVFPSVFSCDAVDCGPRRASSALSCACCDQRP